MAGLLAARVLADFFERVTVIERDRLPDGPFARKGLPQARHIHILLARGRDILEQLFPGFQADLLAQGAQCVDVINDVEWFGPLGWNERVPSGIITPACGRDLLDWTIRCRLTAHYPRIRFLEEAEVVGLISNADQTWVTGVQIRQPAKAEDETITADLIVDASGRGSKAPEWLHTLGYRAPQETIISAQIGYASRIITWSVPSSWAGVLMQPIPPKYLRGGALFPLDAERWIVTLSGACKDYPPTDEAGFVAFARGLRHPLLYETIRDAEPLSPIVGSRSTENRWRHYERLSQWPDGFILLGDAVCALNPVYGQGMSAAAMGALKLRDSLHRQFRTREGTLSGWAHHFQRELAKVNKPIWLLATGEDFRYPQAVGGRRNLLTKLAHNYIDQILRRANRDPMVYKRLVEVLHLLKPPTALITPRILVASLAESLSHSENATDDQFTRLRV
jgi:2-polyprenyl-6-methoxyphenol hydroxylase-like FAD-dependent oxidoreductase